MRAVGVVGRCDNSSGGHALVEFGPINALDFFLGDVALSQKSFVRLKGGKRDYECEDQTLCDLERWV